MTKPAGREQHARGVLVSLAVLYVVWSTTYLAIKIAVQTLPPFYFGGIRYLIAALLMMAGARAFGAKMPDARTWKNAVVLGAFYFGVGNGFVAVASREIGSGVVSIVCATMPIWTALFGHFGGEETTWREWVGLLLGIVGVAVLEAGRDLHVATSSIVLLFVAPLGWASATVLVRRWNRPPPNAPPRPFADIAMGSGVQMLTGALWLCATGFATGESIGRVSTESWLAVAYLVVFGSIAGFLAYTYAVEHARPAVATSYAYVNPALALLLAATAGHEQLGPHVLVGAAIILSAVLVVVVRFDGVPAGGHRLVR